MASTTQKGNAIILLTTKAPRDAPRTVASPNVTPVFCHIILGLSCEIALTIPTPIEMGIPTLIPTGLPDNIPIPIPILPGIEINGLHSERQKRLVSKGLKGLTQDATDIFGVKESTKKLIIKKENTNLFRFLLGK